MRKPTTWKFQRSCLSLTSRCSAAGSVVRGRLGAQDAAAAGAGTQAKLIAKHYNLLYVDVKRYEINMDLMENYGIPAEEGIPRVLVFNHNKELINNTTTAEWRTARERSRQDIFNFFQTMER